LSRKFLTPVGLPSGNTLPSIGSAGDLFFKANENKVYVYTGSSWINTGGGASSVAELTDVELTTLANNQILLYNSTSSKWENVDTDVLTGANYDVLDGGSADSMYLVTVNGGDANG
jgi:hypothetical protein